MVDPRSSCDRLEAKRLTLQMHSLDLERIWTHMSTLLALSNGCALHTLGDPQ
jgi:hypothetical protein